jgi:arginyl-tRNA--protein-N-Asp/Glu arginylyltransferase
LDKVAYALKVLSSNLNTKKKHREMNQEIIETPEVLQPAQADEETYQSLQDYARLVRRNYNKSDFLTVPVPAKSTSFYL